MKNVCRLLGITVLIVVIGFSIAACSNSSGGGGTLNLAGTSWTYDTGNTVYRITFGQSGDFSYTNSDTILNVTGTYTVKSVAVSSGNVIFTPGIQLYNSSPVYTEGTINDDELWFIYTNPDMRWIKDH